MKKLFYFAALLIVIASISCKKDPGTSVQDAYNAKFYIKAATQTKSYNSNHLSNLEIVKQAVTMAFRNVTISPEMGTDSTSVFEGGWIGKDTVSAVPAFIMGGYQIIGQYGTLETAFLKAYNIVICVGDADGRYRADTIAYIPNTQMRENERLITIAYNNNDIDEVLRLFNNAWAFIPITGAEYRELKKSGTN
jgi:hypothetical protein